MSAGGNVPSQCELLDAFADAIFKAAFEAVRANHAARGAHDAVFGEMSVTIALTLAVALARPRCIDKAEFEVMAAETYDRVRDFAEKVRP